METRHPVRLLTNQPLERQFKQIADRHGMTVVSLSSFLIDWFASQDDSIQSAMLAKFPCEVKEDIRVMILKKMAG